MVTDSLSGDLNGYIWNRLAYRELTGIIINDTINTRHVTIVVVQQ